MIDETILHYKIIKKLSEACLLKCSGRQGGLARRSILLNTKGKI